MAEIVLVRHGQANSAAKDEVSYDRLSDLGHQQARWLGEHLSATNGHFDNVICGDMRRHRETAAGIGFDSPQVDARWNELSYFALSEALERKTGAPHPGDTGGFIAHVDEVFSHWKADGLDNVPETYANFDASVTAALEDAAQLGGRSLVVTSTGVIAMVLRNVLDLSHRGHMKMIVQTANTSLHRVERLHDTFYVAEYGATPHLDTPERRSARTHY